MTRKPTIIVLLAALGASPLLYAQATQPVAAEPAPTTLPATPSPLERANRDAVAQLRAQILAEQLVKGISVQQLLGSVAGEDALGDGLTDAEQVGGPRYVTDDLVQVQLQISGARVAAVLRQAVNVRPAQSSIRPDRLDAILRSWDRRVFTSTGDSGNAAAGMMANDSGNRLNSTSQTQPTVALPERAPAWARDMIVVSATAPRAASPLLTARAAEQAARDQLRERLGVLRLDANYTLGDLAVADRRWRDSIDHAIGDAAVAGVDYRSDGSVDIRIAVDGQRLWQALELSR